jgi:hypothetical protein
MDDEKLVGWSSCGSSCKGQTEVEFRDAANDEQRYRAH